MICMKCGRELQKGAVKCKGCGWVVRRRETKKNINWGELLLRETKFGSWPVWQVMTLSAAAMAVLLVCGLTLPKLAKNIPEIQYHDDVSDGDFVDDVPLPVQKTGLVLMLPKDIIGNEIKNLETVLDDAYDDGSCYTEILVNGGDLKVKLQRMLAGNGTLLGQMPGLYPDLAGEITFAGTDFMFGEYAGSMWHIPAEEATGGMVVDVLYIPTGEYDQIMQIEVSKNKYNSVNAQIDKILESVMLFKIDSADAASED